MDTISDDKVDALIESIGEMLGKAKVPMTQTIAIMDCSSSKIIIRELPEYLTNNDAHITETEQIEWFLVENGYDLDAIHYMVAPLGQTVEVEYE
jgi:hypothetical protein